MLPINIQLSKISIAYSNQSTEQIRIYSADGLLFRNLVGLGGIEPPTSPLSGVRSSHLSYRPKGMLVELVGIEPATS